MTLYVTAQAIAFLGVSLTAVRVLWGMKKNKTAVEYVNMFYDKHAEHLKKITFENHLVTILDIPGDTDKEVVLFIHGSCARMGQWDHQISEMSSKGHRVVAYDALGCGQSDKPDQLHLYKPSKFVDTADHIIQSVILPCPKRKSKVVLVGHSFGTYVAISVAQRHASLVSHKVLIGGTPMWNDTDGMKSKLAIFKLPNIMLWYLRPILGLSFQKLALSKETGVRLRIQEAEASSRNPVFMFAHFWRSVHQLETPELTDIPSLCLTGIDDLITPPHKCDALSKLLPNATFQTINGASHQVMQEMPSEVNSLILSFIKQRREKAQE